jgi:hypothetical protein
VLHGDSLMGYVTLWCHANKTSWYCSVENYYLSSFHDEHVVLLRLGKVRLISLNTLKLFTSNIAWCHCLLTDSVHHPWRRTTNSSASQIVPHILWNLKVYYCHQSPPLVCVPIPSNINPVEALAFLKICIDIYSHIFLGVASGVYVFLPKRCMNFSWLKSSLLLPNFDTL